MVRTASIRFLGTELGVPLPRARPVRPRAAAPSAPPGWRWLLIVGLLGLGLALKMGVNGLRTIETLQSAACFGLAGLLLLLLGLGRRYRSHQARTWHYQPFPWH